MVPGGLGLVAQRNERGLAGLDDHRVGCLEGQAFAGHMNQHLAAAGVLWRLVAGTGDVRAAQRLPGLVEVHAQGRQGTGGGGVGIGERGEQQVVRADRLRAGHAGRPR